jgi:hypothetical protein
MFPGIGALPEPATESHVVNKGTLVPPCRLKAQRKRVTRVGGPCRPVFPNIMSCLKSPITDWCVGRPARRRSESGHDGGWRLRVAAVANCEATDRFVN